MPFLSMVHTEDRETVETAYRSLLRGQDFGPLLDLRIVTKSGDIRWLSITGTRIEWEGESAGVVFISDITILVSHKAPARCIQLTAPHAESHPRAENRVSPNERIAHLRSIYQRRRDIDGVLHDMYKHPDWYEDPVRRGYVLHMCAGLDLELQHDPHLGRNPAPHEGNRPPSACHGAESNQPPLSLHGPVWRLGACV
jgi:hypothetical protein